MRLMAAAALLLTSGGSLPPVVYRCTVARKVDDEQVYTEQQRRQGQFSVVVRDLERTAVVSRCSFAQSQGRVTCDDYQVDRIESDPQVGVRKYYVFRSQFDVQIFADLSFVENSGRGGIAYGACKMAPG